MDWTDLHRGPDGRIVRVRGFFKDNRSLLHLPPRRHLPLVRSAEVFSVYKLPRPMRLDVLARAIYGHDHFMALLCEWNGLDFGTMLLRPLAQDVQVLFLTPERFAQYLQGELRADVVSE